MTGAKSTLEFFEETILKKKELAITIPYHFSHVLLNPIKFPSVKKTESHTIDMRSEQEKELVRLSKNTHKLNSNIIEWNDKP